MKIFIINLKNSTKRKDFMLKQLQKYNITNYEFIDAVDGNNLSIGEIQQNFDRETYNNFHKKHGKNEMYMQKGALGCALSHIMAYKKILNECENCLILEDDVIISKEFAEFANSDFKFPNNIDILYVGFTSFVSRDIGNVYLKSLKKDLYLKIDKEDNIKLGGVNFYKNLEPVYGTFGYMINKTTAKNILMNDKIIAEIDEMIRYLTCYITVIPLVETPISYNMRLKNTHDDFNSQIAFTDKI